jgi:hypothetical protein
MIYLLCNTGFVHFAWKTFDSQLRYAPKDRLEEKLGMYLPFESRRSALIFHSNSHATAEQLLDLRPF